MKQNSVFTLGGDDDEEPSGAETVYLTSSPRPLLPPQSSVKVLRALESNSFTFLLHFQTAALLLSHSSGSSLLSSWNDCRKVSAAVTLSRKLPGCWCHQL